MKVCTACWSDSHAGGIGAQYCMCCATGHGTGEEVTAEIYEPELHGQDDVRRNRVREWLELNGVDTRFVSVDMPVYLMGGRVYYGEFERDTFGRKVFREELQGPIIEEVSADVKVEWTEQEEQDNG